METINHLTIDNKNLILDKCQEMETLLSELKSQMESQPKHVDSKVTLEELERRQIALEGEVNAILSAPAPAPKKEEKKDEAEAPNDTTSPQPDAEMQEEQTDQ